MTTFVLYIKNQRASLVNKAQDGTSATYLHHDLFNRSMAPDLRNDFSDLNLKVIDESGEKLQSEMRRSGGAYNFSQRPATLTNAVMSLEEYRKAMTQRDKVMADIKSGRAAEEFAKKKTTFASFFKETDKTVPAVSTPEKEVTPESTPDRKVK